jgi:lysozyme family protein
MDRNFERALSLVLKHEGGYSDHPRDPGGATNLGITLDTLSSWRGQVATKSDVRALTVPVVSPIYRRRYWDAVEADGLPSGLDYAVFDFAVNSGVSRAAKYLQAIVGVPQDGKIGPVTLAAVKERDAADLIEKFCANRLAFLRGLSTFDTFGKGWTSRVNGVLKDALLMAVSPTPPIPDIPHYPQPIPIVLPPAAPKRGIGGWIVAAVVIAAAAAAVALFTPIF